MAHKYSFYQLRIACQQHMVASLYVEPDDPDAFSAGYVEAVTPRYVLLWNMTPWGQPDGWILRRTEDVLQVFMGDDFEVRLQILLEMNGVTHTPLFDPPPGPEDDILYRMLNQSMERQEVVSIMTAEDTYSGRILQLDDLRATLEVFDFFGSVEGERQFPLRDMQLVTVATNDEVMYKRLNEEKLKLIE